MKWINRYTLTSKPNWQNITADAALLMSQVAGSKGRYAQLWGRIGRTTWLELRHGIPRIVPDEPTVGSQGEYHLPANAVVNGISVIVTYRILPALKAIEVEYLICTSAELKARQQHAPVKIWVMPDTSNAVNDSGMPAVLPVSGDI
jgi:hypothetical protein